MHLKIVAAFHFILAAFPAFAGSTVPALVDSQPVATAEPGWEFRTAFYGWGTMLDGDVTVRGFSAPVDVGFDEILDNLDYAVMGVVEIGRGEWSLLADLFIAQLSADASRRNLDFETRLDQFIGNFAITYNAINTPGTRFDVLAGARVNSMDLNLDIATDGFGTFSGSQGRSWVDPVIGARFQQELSERFFLRSMADIGGFGVSSDFTWQALAALGYRITDATSVAVGYRGLGTDYEDGGFGYDVISHGVVLGLECKF